MSPPYSGWGWQMTIPAGAPAGTASRLSRATSEATASVADCSGIMRAWEYGRGARSSNNRADLLPHAEADRSLPGRRPGRATSGVGGAPSRRLHGVPAGGRGPTQDAGAAAAGAEPGAARTGAGLDRVLARNRPGYRAGEAPRPRPGASASVASSPLGHWGRARGRLPGVDDALGVGPRPARPRGTGGRQLGQLGPSRRESHGLPHARARHDGRVGLRPRRLINVLGKRHRSPRRRPRASEPSRSASAPRVVPWRAASLRPAGNCPRGTAAAPRPAAAA